MVKSSPLTYKNNVPGKNGSNNINLSSSHLIKFKSAGVEYGGPNGEKPKNMLNKLHLEKRVSNSASSKVKSGEST